MILDENFDLQATLKSAEAGELEAILALTDYYSWIEPNDEESIKYLELAVGKGDLSSICSLANLYKEKENHEKAIELYKLAISKDCINGYFGLISYVDNENDAIELLKEAEKLATDGTSEDMLNLANCARTFDIEKCKAWLFKAEEAGNERAKLQLEIINLVEEYANNKTEDLFKTILFKIIAMVLEIEESAVTENSTFDKDLGADDLDMFELIYTIEEELSLSIPDEAICDDIPEDDESYHINFTTVKELLSICKE